MTHGFGAESTADEVLDGIDLSGQLVLVTGVSAGLGVETARAASAHGATVIGMARDLAKAARALGEAGCDIEVLECDLASLASVRACADALLARHRKLDVVIANAGVMNCPFGLTEDGFETHFATNHLGHFVLVNRILPLVSNGGRIVILSSSAHRAGDVDLDDPNWQRQDYDPFAAYGRSKTANILYAVELNRRLAHRNIAVTALHPGGIQTELMRHTTPELFERMVESSSRSADGTTSEPVKVKTVAQGAATTVWAAFVAPAEEIAGRYCEDCHVSEIEDNACRGVRSYAVDPDRARALWVRSEEMVGERFET
ncbi:MAG: SDR family NAD(P)-dependent oxidoreductase [Novosphingobium sp.]|nr:SDR family NAD(P)-dependent oxidoreductase [Novosphingobium sp.]